MSMIGTFIRLSTEHLNMFINDSSLLEEYIDSEEVQESENYLDIDKSWDGINFILIGYAMEMEEPLLSQIFFSGQIVDQGQDLGYGPAQYLTSDQVKVASEKLVQLSEKDFHRKYDSVLMNEKGVYPGEWNNSEEDISYLADYFEKLRNFYQDAAKAGQAVICFIS